MDHVLLDTTFPELKLVQLQQEHSDEIYNLTIANYQHLRKWLPWVESIHSSEDTETFIHYYDTKSRLKTGLQCGLRYNGKFIGVIGIDIIINNHIGSIGYWISENVQGHGFTTLACQSLIDYCFESLGINRIEIRCAVENISSNAIPKKIGFTFEGILRESEYLYDRYHDLNLYSLLRKDRND